MAEHPLPAALLLDVDGTLVDSEPLQSAAYRTYFEQRGWSHDDFSIFTGRRAADVFATVPGPWTGEDVDELHDAVVACLDPDARPEPVPGAAEVVRAAAAAGVPVAVVTSAWPPWVEIAVGEVLGVLHLVDVVVTASDVADGKPHPAGFALACERLGVPAAHALAAEDSPAGVAAARAAGAGRVLGVTTSRSAADLREAGASETAPDLRGLAAELEVARSRP